MNVENEWGGCVEYAKVKGPVTTIMLEEVKLAFKHMKNGKASGPTGVVVEMLKAGGDGLFEIFVKDIQ